MRKMKFIMTVAVALSATCLLVSSANATLVTAGADLADTYIQGDGTTGATVGWGGDQQEQVSGTNSREYILVFQLPGLGGEIIQSADITFMVNQPTWQTWGNVDLYGVRSNAASTVVTGDYGAFGNSASGTKIDDDILVASGGTGAFTSRSTDALGDAALATWLDAQYSSVGAGGYIFLRFQPDHTDAIASHAIEFASANHATQAHPVLSITTSPVPEPSSLALIGLASLMMLVIRKKR